MSARSVKRSGREEGGREVERELTSKRLVPFLRRTMAIFGKISARDVGGRERGGERARNVCWKIEAVAESDKESS